MAGRPSGRETAGRRAPESRDRSYNSRTRRVCRSIEFLITDPVDCRRSPHRTSAYRAQLTGQGSLIAAGSTYDYPKGLLLGRSNSCWMDQRK